MANHAAVCLLGKADRFGCACSVLVAPSRGRFAYGVTSNTVPTPLAPPMGVAP